MNSIDRALDALDPISLADANDLAELQTRVDRKYLVNDATLTELLAELGSSARVLEIDGERSCRYHSTYFDTADFALYRAAVQGRRERYKVRSRRYGETGPCFLEVKAKGRRGGNVKSRIDYCRAEHDAITAAGHDFIEAVTGGRHLSSALRPVLTTDYRRTTVIDAAQCTRLTFDRGLRCADASGSHGDAVLDAIVVETKSPRAPGAADRWLWRHGVRPTSISKYGTGLATLRPDLPGNTWHRVIDRHWHERDTSATVS